MVETEVPVVVAQAVVAPATARLIKEIMVEHRLLMG
jgi:hypothetical protein